jgi:hypothetical protein
MFPARDLAELRQDRPVLKLAVARPRRSPSFRHTKLLRSNRRGCAATRVATPSKNEPRLMRRSKRMRDTREAYMRQFICLSLCAGLFASSSAAAAADISTWRWQVSQALRAQQERDADAAKVEASAFEITPGMQQRNDPVLYSGDLKAAVQAQSVGQ